MGKGNSSKTQLSGLSAEEVESLRAERALKKQQKKQEQAEKLQQRARDAFHQPDFVQFDVDQASQSSSRIKLLSWNILAQGLIRRTLFPGSDCLKFSQRNELFMQILLRDPDIATLQEVDRWQGNENEHRKFLDTHAPDVYDSVYEKGYAKKKHGLAILWKKDKFEPVGDSLLIKLDDALLPGTSRTGLSRITRNIGLVVALRDRKKPDKGVIVVTHHLFWHPKQVYERARQALILLHSVLQYRKAQNLEHFPILSAGDFNMQPTELGYHLLSTGGAFDPSNKLHHFMKEDWEASRTVHSSLDGSKKALIDSSTVNQPEARDAAGQNGKAEEGDEDDEEEEEEDPDKVLTGVRSPTKEDGLIEFDELLELAKSCGMGTSLYEQRYAEIEGVELFKHRRKENLKALGHEAADEDLLKPVAGDNESVINCFKQCFA